MKRFLPLFFLLALGLHAADTELTNYKSGISLDFGDSATTAADKGVGYMEEYLYFDKVVSDAKVVYIKSDTAISASHNARNVAGVVAASDTYEVVATDVGTIRYRVDGDQHWGKYIPSWPSWSDTSFGSLNYGLYGAPETNVVGTTGRVGTLTLDDKSTTYYRGIVDSVGDEWHTLTMADDDSARSGSAEFKASDGKIWLFVVNPKTPCLTWRVTGNGQFYTTPPKKWFIPIIYDQTTYLNAGTGTVTVELRDINGGNISYKINGGSTVNVGANNVTLDQDDFSAGPNTLEYWVTATPQYTKTRTVVKNPAYPSASEAHGDRLWVNATQWTSEVRPRLLNNSSTLWWVNQWRGNSHTSLEANARTGVRTGYKSAVLTAQTAFQDALVARIDGMTYTKSGEPRSFIEYAKRQLFETPSIMDPVGGELNTAGNAIPSREFIYRGYYDVRPIMQNAAAYDIIAGYFRADQGYANGLTAIEDYFIRDALARWVHKSSTSSAGYADPAWDEPDSGGMWDTAAKAGASMVAAMMPAYSTEYFGTCGLDGNTTTYPWTPFATVEYTWRDVFLDNDAALTQFPDVHNELGFDKYNFRSSDGQFVDRISYSSSAVMGYVLIVHYNILKLVTPENAMPATDMGMSLAAGGQLLGIKDSSGPAFRAWAGLQNAWFPSFRSTAQPTMLALPSTDAESLGKQYNVASPWIQLWYNHELPLPDAPAGTVEQPTFSPAGGSYGSAQSVAISSSTSGASIRYTTDGSVPTASVGTIYSTPVSISSDTTLRAIAYKATMNDSSVRSEVYTIGQAVLGTPQISPSGYWAFAQSVAITPPDGATAVYYTTDGSDPDETDTLYSAPFVQGTSATIKARAYGAGYDPSAIASASLTIGSITSATDQFLAIRIPERSGQFRLSVTVRSSQDGANVVWGLADDLPEGFTFSNLAVANRQNGGTFSAHNGSSYAAVNSVAALGNTDYTVVLDVDQTARTYSMTVDGTVVATDYGFREAAPTGGINYVVVWNGTGTVTLSNFSLGEYGGTGAAQSGTRQARGSTKILSLSSQL